MFAVATTTVQPLWSDRMVWETSPATMKRSNEGDEDETSLLPESASDRKRRRTLAMAGLPTPGNALLSSPSNMQKDATLSMQSIRSTSVGSNGSAASSSSTTPGPTAATALSSPASFSALELDTLRRLSNAATNPNNGFGSLNKTPYNHASNLSRLLLASSRPSSHAFDAASAAASATLSSLGIESQNYYNAARSYNSTRFLPSLRGGDASSMQSNLSHAGAKAEDLQQRQRIDELLRSASTSSSTPASSYGSGYLSRSISDNLPSSMQEISPFAASAAAAGRNPMASREEEFFHQLRLVQGASLIGGVGGWNRWPPDRSSLMASRDSATIESLRNSIMQQQRLHSSGISGTPPAMSSSRGSTLPMSAMHGGRDPAPAAHSYAHLFGAGTTTQSSNLPHPQDLSMARLGSSSDTRLGLASAFGPTGPHLSTAGGGPFDMKGSKPLTDLRRASSAPSAAEVAKKPRPSAQNPPSPAGRFVPPVMHTSSATSESLLERLPFPKYPQQPIPHFQERPFVPLSTDEDQNWLSDLLCFVRSDLVEVFRATEEDVRQRNSSKRVRQGQVGLRCRFCAHLPQGSKVGRSSSFPSSLDRIYQSLTMMLRDHFARCTAMPASYQQRFIELKRRTTQGATDSKQYWIHAARKMGLEDTSDGIWVCRPTATSPATTPVSSSHVDTGKPTTEEQVSKVPTSSSSGEPSKPQESGKDSDAEAQETSNTSMSGISLVSPKDEDSMSPYMYLLLSNIRLVHMEKSEQTGNRKSLPVGLPGLGCAHCCQSDRRGLCRIFPSRRRTLIHKMDDLYQHFLKCNVCPTNVKEQLVALHEADVHDNTTSTQSKKNRTFVEELWTRMGHGTSSQET